MGKGINERPKGQNIWEKEPLRKRILAISNHADMLGGGERLFLDMLLHLSTKRVFSPSCREKND
jgi:hypothetical protein